MSALPTLRIYYPVSRGLGYSGIERGRTREYPLSAIKQKPLWIAAGQFAYKIEYLERSLEISFQRYTKIQGIAEGSIHRLPLDSLARKSFVIGREEGNYLLGNDHYLSRKHFSLSIITSRKSLVLVVRDMNSLNGTYSPKMRSGKTDRTAQEEQRVHKGVGFLSGKLGFGARIRTEITLMGNGEIAIPPLSIFITPEGKLADKYCIDNWPVVLQLEVTPKSSIIIKDIEFRERYSVERKPCGPDGVLLDYEHRIPGEMPEQLKDLVQAIADKYNKRILAAK